jgi:UDP-N-acetyl-D-mannosaminuronate dehydrogenase
VDPSYLSWKTEQQLGYGVGFIAHALSVNNRMPHSGHPGRPGAQRSEPAGQRQPGSTCSDWPYKPGVNDARESPGSCGRRVLLRSGALVSYTDRHLPVTTIGGQQFTSVPLDSLAR